MNKRFYSLFAIALFSCGDAVEEVNTLPDVESQLQESLEALNLDIPTEWMEVSDSTLCSLEIPAEMALMDKLNPDATIKYGQVSQEEDKVYENYILVIPETYEELESFGSSVQFDINSYNKACLEKLTSGLVEFTEVETTEEELDGNKAIIQKLVGSKQIKEDLSIDIFYELAVIEGEKGYYQVLSWTLADQRSKFESNMDRMTNSFKEI